MGHIESRHECAAASIRRCPNCGNNAPVEFTHGALRFRRHTRLQTLGVSYCTGEGMVVASGD